jgi:hypothetical protein
MYWVMPHEVQKQKLDARIGKFGGAGITAVPAFERDKNKKHLDCIDEEDSSSSSRAMCQPPGQW